ncbi:hypothetical protein ACFX13_025192 [Malus domestica]
MVSCSLGSCSRGAFGAMYSLDSCRRGALVLPFMLVQTRSVGVLQFRLLRTMSIGVAFYARADQELWCRL